MFAFKELLPVLLVGFCTGTVLGKLYTMEKRINLLENFLLDSDKDK